MGAPNTLSENSSGSSNEEKTGSTATATDAPTTTLTTYLSLVQQYLGVFMYDNALWLAERCVAEYPTDTEALYLLGLCHFRSGKPKAARLILERLPRSACSGSMLFLLAQCSYDLREYTRAEEALLRNCRTEYKLNRPNALTGNDSNGSSNAMDDWILHTTPCPIPNGAAGLALLGNICRSTNRKERAINYFEMSLRLDPFLWTSFEALAELGAQVQAADFFGTPSARASVAAHTLSQTVVSQKAYMPIRSGSNNAMHNVGNSNATGGNNTNSHHHHGVTMTVAKTPLQPMETPGASHMQSSFYPSTGIRPQRTVHFETPGFTPIPVNASLMPGDTPASSRMISHQGGGYGYENNPTLLRRAREVAARNYYPPSPETPMTSVTHSMRYLRGIGSNIDMSTSTMGRNESNLGGRSLFACENQTANLANTASKSEEDVSQAIDPEKPEKVSNGKVQDILETMSIAGTAYQRLRQYRCKEAIQLLQSLPPHQQSTGWVLQQQGRAYLELNDFLSAQRCLEWMQHHDPGRMKGLELLSTVYWQLKKETELSHLAHHVISFDRLSPEAWCVLGNCFSLQKDHETALQFFGRSLQLDPDFTYTHTLSGYEYMANEDFDKAFACFRQALRTDDNHYNAWYGLGAIHHRQEKYDLAEFHFEKAVSLHPFSSVLRCNLGIAQFANGKAYQALETLSEAFRLDPRNPQARYQRATIYLALHRPEEALEELRKVRDAAPREATVHFAMGKVLKRLGRPEDAIKCFLTAMDLDPKDNQIIKSAMDKLDEPDVDEETMAAF